VIAGFPGETEDDHARTVALVRSLPFTYLHVFPFSARPGTAAERLPQRVSGVEIASRAAELRALAADKSAGHRARRDGELADVVAVGAGPMRDGVTEDYLTVKLDAASPPRGSRFRARLRLRGQTLLAVPAAV
jgi:threonylcarbamoyladenosine tRNA methylthiotransferase MtaB